MEQVLKEFITDPDPRQVGKRLYEALKENGQFAIMAEGNIEVLLRSVYFQAQEEHIPLAEDQGVIENYRRRAEKLQQLLTANDYMGIVEAKTLVADARQELTGRVRNALGISKEL